MEVKEEDEDIPAKPPTTEETIDYLIMSLGESPSLKGPGCVTLGESWDQSTKTFLVHETIEKNLGMEG
jgi:hypothetical protein